MENGETVSLSSKLDHSPRQGLMERLALARYACENRPSDYGILVSLAAEAEQLGLLDLASRALSPAGLVAARSGQIEVAKRLIESSATLGRKSGSVLAKAQCRFYGALVWFHAGDHDRSFRELLAMVKQRNLQELELIQRADLLRSLAEMCAYVGPNDAGLLCWQVIQAHYHRDSLPMHPLMRILRALFYVDVCLLSQPAFCRLLLVQPTSEMNQPAMLEAAERDCQELLDDTRNPVEGIRRQMAEFAVAASRALRVANVEQPTQWLHRLDELRSANPRLELMLRTRLVGLLLATNSPGIAAEFVNRAPAYEVPQVDAEEWHRWMYVCSETRGANHQHHEALLLFHQYATAAALHIPKMALRARELLLTVTKLPGARPTDNRHQRPAYLVRALALLEDDIGISVSGLAEAVGVSERTLREAFQVYLGLSPKRHLMGLKLDAAKHQIETGMVQGRSVEQLAFTLEFTNPGRFSAEFKRRFGMSPSELAKARTAELKYTASRPIGAG